MKSLISIVVLFLSTFSFAQPVQHEPPTYLSFCKNCDEVGLRVTKTSTKKGKKVVESATEIKLNPSLISVYEKSFVLHVKRAKFPFEIAFANLVNNEKIYFFVSEFNGYSFFYMEGDIPIEVKGNILYIGGIQVKDFECFKNPQHFVEVVEWREKNE